VTRKARQNHSLLASPEMEDLFKTMSHPQRRPSGWRDYLTFFRSTPKLGLEIVVLVACLLTAVIIGATTSSPMAGLIGGSLLILGAVLLINVAVKFYQWVRARPH
jgi:hypothetical protein